MFGRIGDCATILVVLCVTVARGDVTADVCGKLTGNLVNVDNLDLKHQKQFTVHVEAVMPDLDNIINGQLSLDTTRSVLRLNQHSYRLSTATIVDYKNKEKLFFDFLSGGRGSCQASQDVTSKMDFWLLPSKSDDGQIGPLNVLRMSGFDGIKGPIQLRDAGSTTYRNLKVKKYVSCQRFYDARGKSLIAKVTHFVSDNGVSSLSDGKAPLKVVMEAKYEDGSSTELITRTYNLLRYKTGLEYNELETPVGIVCEGRKNGDKKFPDLPVYVSFSQEIHYPEGDQRPMEVLQTTYDLAMNYVTEVVFDHRSRRQSELRFDDFATGLSYAIDYQTNFCQVKNISESFNVNDYVTLPSGKIRMATPEEFYGAADVTYHYGGEEIINGVQTERWHGSNPANPNRVTEWYFTKGIKHSVNDFAGSKNAGKQFSIPFKRMLWTDATSNYYSNYFFQVDYAAPNLFQLDLSPCFPNSKSQKVVLRVPALEHDIGANERATSLRSASQVLQKVMGVRFTRMSDLQMYFFDKRAYLTFTLLDKAGHSSDLDRQIIQEKSLQEAIDALKKAIKNRSLFLRFGNDEESAQSNVVWVNSPETIRPEAKLQSTGYSAGSLAGLAVGMIIVGLAGGGAGGYWFLLKQS